MKTFVAALAAFTILFGGVVAYCQTPLDAPGEKKVTVASEIERGLSEMADAATSSHKLNLLSYDVDCDGWRWITDACTKATANVISSNLTNSSMHFWSWSE